MYSTRGSESPTCCPPTIPRRGAPFTRQGSRRTGSPTPYATMRHSDSLRPSPLASFVVRSAVPPRAPVFVSPLRPDAGLRPGALRSGNSHASRYRGGVNQGLPRFPGNPYGPVPCSSTPAGPDTPRPVGVPILPPCCQKRRLQRVVLSRLNRTALALAVHASSGGLPHHGARLASGDWLSPAGWDWLPTGLLRKVSKIVDLLLLS